MLAANAIDNGVITPEGLRWLIERCVRAGHIDRLELPGLKDERRAVFAGGLALLYTLAAQFGIQALRPARGALRQGVIIDLHERHAALRAPGRAARTGAAGGDIRDASVRGLQRRFAVNTAQAARVRRVATALYANVALEDGADDGMHGESDRELGWACDLHEIGMMVSHHDHHRHSAYLLGNADAAGFSQSQQRHLAAMVLGQRGGLRKIETALTQRAFTLQVLALRLAVIKCHARGSVDSRALRLERSAPRRALAFHARMGRRAPANRLPAAAGSPGLGAQRRARTDAWTRRWPTARPTRPRSSGLRQTRQRSAVEHTHLVAANLDQAQSDQLAHLPRQGFGRHAQLRRDVALALAQVQQSLRTLQVPVQPGRETPVGILAQQLMGAQRQLLNLLGQHRQQARCQCRPLQQQASALPRAATRQPVPASRALAHRAHAPRLPPRPTPHRATPARAAHARAT